MWPQLTTAGGERRSNLGATWCGRLLVASWGWRARPSQNLPILVSKPVFPDGQVSVHRDDQWRHFGSLDGCGAAFAGSAIFERSHQLSVLAECSTMRPSPTQYATENNPAARQRLWAVSRYEPAFALYHWVIAVAGLRGGEAILGVGCGNGAYLELMEAVGLDVSVGVLAAARRRARGPLVAGDVARLPLATSSFDVVLAAHMLYHVDDRATAALEIRRVLRPSGVLVAVTNRESNHPGLMELVDEVMGNGWRWLRPSDNAFSLENLGQ